MKYSLFLFTLLFSTQICAQDVDSTEKIELPHTIIKLSPLQFFYQTLELSLETLNADYSRSFQLSAALRSGQGNYIDGHGGGLTLAYRKYVRSLSAPIEKNPKAFQGIYYSVYLKGEYFKGEEEYYGQSQFEKTEEKITSINPAFTIGLHRTIFEVLFLDVYFGGGIKFADVQYIGTAPSEQINYDIFHPAYEGIHPVMGVKIGVGL